MINILAKTIIDLIDDIGWNENTKETKSDDQEGKNLIDNLFDNIIFIYNNI